MTEEQAEAPRRLDDDEQVRPVERARGAVGQFRSGRVDTSERHDEALDDDFEICE